MFRSVFPLKITQIHSFPLKIKKFHSFPIKIIANKAQVHQRPGFSESQALHGQDGVLQRHSQLVTANIAGLHAGHVVLGVLRCGTDSDVSMFICG